MSEEKWPAFRRSDGTGYATFKGRRHFLRKVAEYVPETIQELRSVPYVAFKRALEADPPVPKYIERSLHPVYGARVAGGTGERVQLQGEWEMPPWAQLHWEPKNVAVTESGIICSTRVAFRERACWDAESTAYPQPVQAFRDAVWQWAEGSHLSDLWCLDVTQKTLRWWYQLEHLGGAGEAVPGFADPDYCGLPVAPFQSLGLESTQLNRTEWFHSLQADVAAYMAREEARIEQENVMWKTLAAVFSNGKEATEPRYLPVERQLPKYLEMLVHWQVQKWTLRRIADEYGYGEMKLTDRLDKKHSGISGVSKALDTAASAIGLARRKGKRGRPRREA